MNFTGSPKHERFEMKSLSHCASRSGIAKATVNDVVGRKQVAMRAVIGSSTCKGHFIQGSGLSDSSGSSSNSNSSSSDNDGAVIERK